MFTFELKRVHLFFYPRIENIGRIAYMCIKKSNKVLFNPKEKNWVPGVCGIKKTFAAHL